MARRGRQHGRQRQPLRVQCLVSSDTRAVANSMQMRQLGDSDLVISEVTLGTMTFGEQNTEAEAHEQLCYAFENGINILDTAEMYPVPPKAATQGSTDRYISTWLKSMPRDKVVVASKVSGYSSNTWVRDQAEVTRVDQKNIVESVEKSLARLGTDHIDLLQIHWPDRYVPLFGAATYDPSKEREAVPFEEQLAALQAVIQQGKVRYVGVSNESSLGVMQFWHAAKTLGLPKIVSIQNCYNLLVRTRFEVDLVEVCSPRNANVGLLAYSPLAGGVLSGKYLAPGSEAAKKGRLSVFKAYMERYRNPLAEEAVREYVRIAEKHGLTPTQLAQAWVRDRWFVTSNIIGATTMEQLKETLSAYALPRPLAEEVEKEIEAVFQQYRDPSLFS